MADLQARLTKIMAKSKLDVDVAVSMVQEAHDEAHEALRQFPDDLGLQECHREIHEFLVERGVL